MMHRNTFFFDGNSLKKQLDGLMFENVKNIITITINVILQ